MSGHFVDLNVPHPLQEQMAKEMPFALRADCPHCGAFPGKPCVIKKWTHIARSEKAKDLDRKGQLLQRKTLNDLPEYIKRDLVAYCMNNRIDPRNLNNMTTDELFNCWCHWNGLVNWAARLANVYEYLREVKG
jgi:hypothetical protein